MKSLCTLIVVILLAGAIAIGQNREARKVDEFEDIPCPDLRGRLDTFLALLEHEKNSTGFVIVYEGDYDRTIYKGNRVIHQTIPPAFGEAAYRTYIYRRHFQYREFPSDRYLFIDGGYRDKHLVELWIVPSGAKLPTAVPTKQEIKFRKGKPSPITCEEG